MLKDSCVESDPKVSKASWEPWLEGRLEAWKGDLQPFLVEHIQTTQQASVAELAFSPKLSMRSFCDNPLAFCTYVWSILRLKSDHRGA